MFEDAERYKYIRQGIQGGPGPRTVLLGMPQFGSEPKFEPELFGTGPRFSSKFGGSAELDHKSGSTFGQSRNFENRCRTQFEPNFL